MNSAHTPEDVAASMLRHLERLRFLDQSVAVDFIRKEFGVQFIQPNDSGNDSIDRRVLKAFKKMSGDDVVWDRSQQQWRRRESSDLKGRLQ